MAQIEMAKDMMGGYFASARAAEWRVAVFGDGSAILVLKTTDGGDVSLNHKAHLVIARAPEVARIYGLDISIDVVAEMIDRGLQILGLRPEDAEVA